eukprot:Nk52_evm31s236 gene=Nk52_evmTU31s236
MGSCENSDGEYESCRTGYIWDERFTFHDTGTHSGYEPSAYRPAKLEYLEPFRHFEHVDTKRRIHSMLAAVGILDECKILKARRATLEELLAFHTEEYIEYVKKLSNGDGGDAGECTVIGRGSYDVALYAAGAAIEAVDALVAGRVQNIYALIRPPGHHAESSRGKGFCIFNNVVLAALQAVEVHGLHRVAIVDFDVHHGNGTQKAFFNDKNVLFISIHQDNLYPANSGSTSEVGEGSGEGYNLNIPMYPGSGKGAYEYAFDRIVIPALKAFDPELILVSCGFDAASTDPLAHMMLSSSDFKSMTEKLMQVQPKMALFHEGGYSAVQVPFCGLAVMQALTKSDSYKAHDTLEEDALDYGGQELQYYQRILIDKIFEQLAAVSPLLRKRHPSS